MPQLKPSEPRPVAWCAERGVYLLHAQRHLRSEIYLPPTHRGPPPFALSRGDEASWAPARAAYQALAEGYGPSPVTWAPGRLHGRLIRLHRAIAAGARAFRAEVR